MPSPAPFQPQTSVQGQSETVISTDRINPKVIDVSVNYSPQTIDVLTASFSNARQKKLDLVNCWIVLDVLLNLKKQPDFITDELAEIIKEKLPHQLEILSGRKTGSRFVMFTPQIKQVLIAAYVNARQEGSTQISLNNLYQALLVHPEVQMEIPQANSLGAATEEYMFPDTIRKFTVNLSQNTKDIQSLQRTDYIESLLRILARSGKHHALVIGEPGVGKSSLGPALAKHLKDTPVGSLSNTNVISINTSTVFSSPGNLGVTLAKIIEESSLLPKSIVFISDISVANDQGQVNLLANFLQNFDRSGHFYLVVLTTPGHYSQFIANHPYFNNNFEVVKVDETSLEDTLEILKLESGKFEKRYNISIAPALLSDVVAYSQRYLPGHLPQKAISLLDEICAGTSINGEKEVTRENVRQIISKKTGIPITTLSVSEKEKMENLEVQLHQRVIGQDEAIIKVSQALRRSRVGLKDPRKPIGSFLFLGPSGVGKTELAKTLSQVIFNDEKAFFRFDMSEFSESHTAQRLIGSPPGYVGYEEGGQLTNPVADRPYCLLLFDEIEKAHPRVFDLFLQVLDDGRLTDSKGQTVDFRNTLIIFTSNIGSDILFAHARELSQPGFDRKGFLESNIMPVVRTYFRPELINRFDDIVMFDPLTKDQLRNIARLKLEYLNKRLEDKAITVKISDEKLDELVEASYNPAYGARPLERAIKDQVENYVAGKIVAGDINEGGVIEWQ